MSSLSESPRVTIEKDAIKKAIGQVTGKTGPHFRTFGSPYMHIFEQSISEKLGGVSVLVEKKLTGALFLALKVLGVGPGDEVIIPAFCSPLNIFPILQLGAVPVFVDICLVDYALDPAAIEEKITERTKAIIVVHLFGQPALGISKILKIAKRNSLPVIENATQTFMGKIKIDGEYKLVGTLGDIGCFGFSLIDGSVSIFQKNGTLYEKAKRLKVPPGAGKVFREDSIERLLMRFKSINHRLGKRRKLAEYYTKQLVGIQEIILPEIHERTENVWFRYVIRTKKSDALFEYLSHRGVKSIYRPVEYFSGLQGKQKQGTFLMSEEAVTEAIFLPMFASYTIRDASRVVALIRTFFQK